jgi:hypothetical protein
MHCHMNVKEIWLKPAARVNHMYRVSLLSDCQVSCSTSICVQNFWDTIRQNPVSSGQQIRVPPITTENVFNLGAHLPFSPIMLTILTTVQCISFVCFWRNTPQVSQGLLIYEISRSHTTFGRTPLDEWSAHRRDLYLITYNTDNRQTSMSLVGFEPTIAAGERP